MARSDGPSTALMIVRIFQILTLIPCWAILAALINIYNSNGNVAPAGVLCLFIVALLASIWAFCVLLVQVRARNTAYWMAVCDVIILAALIAGVVLISNITRQCDSARDQAIYATTTEAGIKIYPAELVGTGDPVWRDDDNCDLAKAAMGLGIANIILFLISAVLAVMVAVQNKREDEELEREKVYVAAMRGGNGQYVGRDRSRSRSRSRSRRHRYRHRSPRSGEYIVEERSPRSGEYIVEETSPRSGEYIIEERSPRSGEYIIDERIV